MITYYEGSEIVPIYNEDYTSSTTAETDSNNGTRNIINSETKRDVVMQQNSGNSTPITAKIMQPKIEGAIVTAAGGGNINIKANIIQAVSAVTIAPSILGCIIFAVIGVLLPLFCCITTSLLVSEFIIFLVPLLASVSCVLLDV